MGLPIWEGCAIGGGGGLFGRIVVRVLDANYAVVATTSDVDVFMRGLSANRTVTLPAAPTLGQRVPVKDEDGSLLLHNIIVDGNGNTVDGAATYTMTLLQNGLKGAVTAEYQGAGWSLV